MVVFGQSGCIPAKVVVFGQSGFIPAKWFYSCNSGRNLQKWLYSGRNCFIRAEIVLFGQKLLYLVKSGCIREKRLYSVKVVVIGQK